MRICFIMYQGNMYSGGQGVYLHYVTRELARMGHDVHVIAGRPYPEVADGVTIHRLKTYSFWSFIDGRDEHAYDDAWQFFHPFNFYEFASTRVTLSSLFMTFSLRAYQKLNELERDGGPFDLIHDNQTLGYGILAMKRLRGRPAVANIHHPLAIDRRNSLAEARSIRDVIGKMLWYPWHMQRLVAARLDRIITGSENSARSVSEALDLPLEHIRVIHDGVDTDIFRPLPDVPKEPATILFVGNSEDRNKGAVYLLRALARLQHELDFRLVFVDRKEKDLKIAPPLVWKYGLQRAVRFTGRVSRDELVRLYNSATLFVSPSLYEGFGLPAAEAMACGLPVVATTAGAYPEFIDDGKTGLLVRPADPLALAEAIKRVLTDADLAARLGAAASERIRSRFTWRRCAEHTLELYEEVLDLREEVPAHLRG